MSRLKQITAIPSDEELQLAGKLMSPTGELSAPTKTSPPSAMSKTIRKYPEMIEAPDWSSPDSFGEPLLFGEIETPEISSTFLPDWVRHYVDAVAALSQTPAGTVAMLVLPVLGACLQKRFEVSPCLDGYTEPLSLWCLIALPPASRKTAVLQSLLSPVIEWEQEQAKQLATTIDRQQIERAIINDRIKHIQRQVGNTKYTEIGREI